MPSKHLPLVLTDEKLYLRLTCFQLEREGVQ